MPSHCLLSFSLRNNIPSGGVQIHGINDGIRIRLGIFIQFLGEGGVIDVAIEPLLQQLVALLTEILNKLDNPVPAIVQMLGDKGLIKQLEKYYKNKKNGNING